MSEPAQVEVASERNVAGLVRPVHLDLQSAGNQEGGGHPVVAGHEKPAVLPPAEGLAPELIAEPAAPEMAAKGDGDLHFQAP